MSDAEPEVQHEDYEVVCAALHKCTLYDTETYQSWWDHVTRDDIGQATASHLDVCTGPMIVTTVKPLKGDASGTATA
jgi:hypothetical protein